MDIVVGNERADRVPILDEGVCLSIRGNALQKINDLHDRPAMSKCHAFICKIRTN